MAENNQERKVVLAGPANGGAQPSDFTQESPVAAPPVSDPMESRLTDTGKLKKIFGADDQSGTTVLKREARRTIRLKPIAETAPGGQTPVAPPPSAAATVDSAVAMPDMGEEPTVKIQKSAVRGPAPDANVTPTPVAVQPAGAPSMAPSIPGTKQTIRLRPSAGSDATPGEAPAARPNTTLKLRPVAEPTNQQEDIGDENTVVVTPKPIKLVKTGEQAAVPSPSAPTIKLAAPDAGSMDTPTKALQHVAPPQAAPMAPPSAPTMKLEEPAPAPGRTLRLKAPTRASQETIPEGGVPPVPGQQPDQQEYAQQQFAAPRGAARRGGNEEPQTVFTVFSIASLLLLMFSLWMLFAQQGRMDWDMDTSVPMLSESIPAPNLAKCKE